MRQWRVRDVMTTDVAAVREATPYRAIVELLIERCVSSLPVLDEAGRVVGIVSEADLLHKLEFAGLLRDRRTHTAAHAKATAAIARDLMTSPALTIGPDALLGGAAAIMETEHLRRLPVVADGRLVGIVSRRDLLRGYLRPDEAIREEIMAEVLEQTMWLDQEIAVIVERGQVTLTGHVDRRSTARIIARLCESVTGVVGVDDRLAYAVDDAG